MQTRNNERSLGELFSELTKETTTLVRQEFALARTEMTQKAKTYGRDAGLATAGAVVLYTGFLALVATVIIALAYALPLWLSALIVTVVLLGIGAALAYMGIEQMRKTKPVPERTIDTLKEDAAWIKEQTT